LYQVYPNDYCDFLYIIKAPAADDTHNKHNKHNIDIIIVLLNFDGAVVAAGAGATGGTQPGGGVIPLRSVPGAVVEPGGDVDI